MLHQKSASRGSFASGFRRRACAKANDASHRQRPGVLLNDPSLRRQAPGGEGAAEVLLQCNRESALAESGRGLARCGQRALVRLGLRSHLPFDLSGLCIANRLFFCSFALDARRRCSDVVVLPVACDDRIEPAILVDELSIKATPGEEIQHSLRSAVLVEINVRTTSAL